MSLDVHPDSALRQMSLLRLILRAGAALAAGALSASVLAATASPATKTAHHATAQHVRKVSPRSHAAPRRHASIQRHHVYHGPLAPVSFGELAGLHRTPDPIGLKAGAALVIDQDTHEILYSKNPEAVLPIASITKLMTATVVLEAHQPMDEVLTITKDDIDTEKFTRSRLSPGTKLTREELLHLALMASENRAAHALARYYPGGLDAAIAAMNAKARELGMNDTHYVEPTGLSSKNQSSAADLAILVNAAHKVPLLREYTTTPAYSVELGRRQVEFHTTNRLVASKSWDIGLQKTGFINEAGQCMVMQAQVAGRKFILVLLDAVGHYARISDAERLRHWIMTQESEQKESTTSERGHHPAEG